jgi:hypothetical protein
MKVVKFLFSCLVILILMNLSACDSTNSNIQNMTITFSQANQQFSIVPFYLNMPSYVKKVKENRTQINRTYKTYVYDPIFDDFASKGECSFLAKNIKNPITDLEGLNTEIEVLSNSGVEGIVKDALLKVSKLLPGPNTTVYLQVITSKNWKNMLPRIVAHEYHHSVWISRNFETIHFSLLDCLILEGRAEGFADLLYPNIEVPWPEFLDREKEHRVWQHMKLVLHSKDEQLILKMLIGDKEIPFLSVYSMGYRIMQEFLKNNPEVSLMEWTDMEPDEILLKSKYEEKFN